MGSTKETPYYDIDVELVGQDGNAFAIMGKVVRALREDGVSTEDITEYTKECMSGDYEHLLAVTGDWVNIV